MIAYLSGTFALKNPAFVIVECNGVGYQVHISLHTYSKIQTLEKGKIHTYMVVREDAQILYGFADEAEKKHVRLVAQRARCGAKHSPHDPLQHECWRAGTGCFGRNDALIQRIKGVGPKQRSEL